MSVFLSSAMGNGNSNGWLNELERHDKQRHNQINIPQKKREGIKGVGVGDRERREEKRDTIKSTFRMRVVERKGMSGGTRSMGYRWLQSPITKITRNFSHLDRFRSESQ